MRYDNYFTQSSFNIYKMLFAIFRNKVVNIGNRAYVDLS